VSEKNVIMMSDEDILLMEELLSEEYLRSIRLLAENNSPRAKERCEMVQSLHIRLVKVKQDIAIKRFLDD